MNAHDLPTPVISGVRASKVAARPPVCRPFRRCGLLLAWLTAPMFALAADREPEGHLPTLYVAPVVAAMSDPNMLWQPAIGSGLTEMLITDLVGLEKFEILESTGLDDLMGELDWASRGWVAAVEGVAKGQWAGTDFMLFAKVLRFGSTEKGLKLPFGVRLGKTLALAQID